MPRILIWCEGADALEPPRLIGERGCRRSGIRRGLVGEVQRGAAFRTNTRERLIARSARRVCADAGRPLASIVVHWMRNTGVARTIVSATTSVATGNGHSVVSLPRLRQRR
jgi:hypothetical protein